MSLRARSELGRALAAIAPEARDAWLDARLGVAATHEDGPSLPRGCTPYLPSSVGVLLEAIDRARITEDDVFVDVGSGLGRALVLVHLVTGARCVGLEIQPELVREARALAGRLGLDDVTTEEGEAEQLVAARSDATVFYFYCPFGAARLSRVLDAIEVHARTRTIRLCFVDMPVPSRPWLIEEPGGRGTGASLTVWRARA